MMGTKVGSFLLAFAQRADGEFDARKDAGDEAVDCSCGVRLTGGGIRGVAISICCES